MDEIAPAGPLAFLDLSQLECFHASPRHLLYRTARLGVNTVVKVGTAPGETCDGAMRREFEMLRDVAGPSIVKVMGLVETQAGLALVMEDAGQENLAELIRSAPCSVSVFFELAIQLTDAVSNLHRARIVHRDIHPGNIVWNAAAGKATLCDFAMAKAFPELALAPSDPGRFEGNLAYMSPEQTGRTSRMADLRTDLYSLGATFYHLLTGSPPFGAGDAVAMAHAQIARIATPPIEVDPATPSMLSRMVVKLLEKEPGNRYQSADALAADLRQASTQWQATGRIEPFPLAAREVPRTLSIPERLYGRGGEVQSLAGAFSRACAGARELVFVTGGPGIGKSALVEGLRGTVADAHGYYAAGKFDQLQRSVPFSGLAQALRSLVRQLLIESEEQLQDWRERIEEAVAPNGQLLLALVPELERVLGPQPEVADVGPLESKNRFQLVVTRFLRVFPAKEHPLVLFLDDLQWVDAASLQLIVQCASDTATHHLLIVGAYRDGEVGPSHPLTLALADLRETGCNFFAIQLQPLRPEAVAQLAVDTFGEEPAQLRFLADLVFQKSAGNPFFVRRLLHLMHAQGLIRFDADTHAWAWDRSGIEGAPISDNVLDVMVLAIDRLPAQAKTLLETAACIGHRFDLATLAQLTDLSLPGVTEQLWPAIEDGLLVWADTAPATLQFAHDRVQQAAYSLLSAEDKQALHHAIGRRLHAQAGDRLGEQLFEIVDQLNLGRTRMRNGDEQDSLVGLNIAAGRKAKDSAAYRAAFEYLSVAKVLLGPDAWSTQPDLAFAVYRELAESAYLAGEHAAAEGLVETLLEHAVSNVARAELYGLRVLAATVASDWQRALQWGREGLSVFGLAWPLERLQEAIEAEVGAVMKNLGTRDIESLVEAPDVEDEEIRASMRLLSLLGAPAYFSGSAVLTFIVSRAVNLSLVHGPSPYSAFAYVLYGGIHNAVTGQYEIGYAFGKLALAMAQRFGNRAEECRTFEVYGVLVHHWKAPLRDGLPLLKEGFRAGVESGELAFAAFNLNSVLINAMPAGIPLGELLEEAEVALDFATAQKNRTSVEIAIPYRQVARALTGAGSSPDAAGSEEFDEARFLEQAANHETALGHYWVMMLQLAYLTRDHARALRCAAEAEKRVATGILGMITSAEHVFYTALAMAAGASGESAERASLVARLRTLHARLDNWSRHCPQNFAHKADLVQAEIGRLEGRSAEASMLCRAAIEHAARHRFVQDEALAHELRARVLAADGEPGFATVHVKLAQDRYRQWGATVKVLALEKEFAELVRAEPPASRLADSIDHMALVKASQAISVETLPERLFDRILRVVIEVAGAQRGALALLEDGGLVLHARVDAAGEMAVSLSETPLDQCTDLPSAIFRYVQRTREFLLLADAGASSLFARDPVVQQLQVRSVLCMPLLKHSALVGVIYLENNAMAGVFSEELMEVGKVLSAQAVISLENSNLLKKMQQLASELEARVVDRTRQLTDQIAARDKAEAALRISESGLRAADRQKDEFLAMLAHELRNPLASISNASELLARTAADNARAEAVSALLRRQTKQLTRLVDDLLDLSRISRGRITLDEAPVEMSEILQQALETVQSLIADKSHRLLVTKAAHSVYVRGDRTRLVQAISNVLHNAAKYTDKGGEISLEILDTEEEVVITVRDNGAGIPAEILPTLFDLFVQSERTLDRSQGGLGIGLSVVKRLIEMHGGSVQARSPGIGQGSTFTIRLPRMAQPQPQPAAKSAQSGVQPLRILIVDDNSDAADSLAMLLQLDGHSVSAAYGATEGLDAAARIKPELMFLDIGLPGMDGYEVARRLRTKDEYASLRLIALSGYGQKEDRERALSAGFDDHLVKPVTQDSLEMLFKSQHRRTAAGRE